MDITIHPLEKLEIKYGLGVLVFDEALRDNDVLKTMGKIWFVRN